MTASKPPATDDRSIDDRAFVHARRIDAPPSRVFRAMAEPERLARWWGPNGFRSSFDVFEFRPGGVWRFTLHGPDGTDYPNENRFVTIDEPGRVVVEHLSDQGHHFVLTITFQAHEGGTRVGWQQVFDTAEHRAQIAAFVVEANEQNLDRLAAEVAGMAD